MDRLGVCLCHVGSTRSGNDPTALTEIVERPGQIQMQRHATFQKAKCTKNDVRALWMVTGPKPSLCGMLVPTVYRLKY